MTAAEKIAALRATHEAATPGSWEWDARGDLRPVPHDEYGFDCIIGHDPIGEVPVLEPANAAAIVSAHNALPALLKALEGVLDIERVPVNRGQVQTYDEGWLDGYNDARREFRAVIEAALAEVDHE